MDLPSDDHIQRAHAELGEPEALFHISRGRFLAKLSLGLSLVLYGVVANYLWWVHGPARFGHIEFLFLFLPPISGISLLLHMYRNRGLFVLIYPTGLLRLRRGDVVSFPWTEIDHVRLMVNRAEGPEFTRDSDGNLRTCWLPVDVPTFKLGDASLIISRDDGIEAHFGPALTGYDTLAAEVQKRTFAALWPRILDRFHDGDGIAFGALEATPAGLRHAGKLLPWREVKELVVAQGKLSVKQKGKWLPWALVDIVTIPNPHLLFALAEEARRFHALPRNEPKEKEKSSPQRHKDRTEGHKEAEN
jgi:hypothetical protein